MATAAKLYTAEDLWRMPGDEPWELWDGELRKVPGAGGKATVLAGVVLSLLNAFVLPRRLGVVSSADGSYLIAREPDTVVVPDVGFVRWERLPDREIPDGYFSVPPDLAVEIVSPSDRPGAIARKQEIYGRAGVPLVWWVYFTRRAVVVYQDGRLVGEFGESDELDGGEILPGFQMSVAEIFATA